MNLKTPKPADLKAEKKPGRWNNKMTYRFHLSLQRKGDADIIFRLAEEPEVSPYIRKALRYYIEHESEIEKAAQS